MTTELTAIRKKLEKKLKEERYIHTLVENIATSMNKSCSAGSITLNCQMPNWRFLR